MDEVHQLLQRWSREVYGNSSADPIPILESIAELIERETENYLKLPIDPFDERHPSRTSRDCALGHILKILFKEESFMAELTNDYIMSRNFKIQVISCRLLLDILPGLESSIVFTESETLVTLLLNWADKGEFPLHSYATGLLGAAMEVPEISSQYREQNNQLVPLILNRLNQITNLGESCDPGNDSLDPKEFVDERDNSCSLQSRIMKNQRQQLNICPMSTPKTNYKRTHSETEREDDEDNQSTPARFDKKNSQTKKNRSPVHNECSNSSWAEAYLSGSYQMHPLSVVMQQRFILQYLSALGDYQELLVHMFEHKALAHILHFIDGRKNLDIRLAFDALKFLAAFLTHKKFALEFLDHGGLTQLLRVNKHGMASSGVGICLYYLAYNENVMERICWMKREIVEKMVSYALWLLECSHDSSRAHATMFFALCFQFPLLLRLFDRDNGLRKLLNVISMRGLISADPLADELDEDEKFSRRQTAKHVCTALKKYTRAHFVAETRKYTRTNIQTGDQECKPTSTSDENVADCIEIHRQQSMTRFNWRLIDRMVQEDGIIYLLKIIAHYCDEGIFFAGKTETIRSALEVLVVCSFSPKVQASFLKEVIRINTPFRFDQSALAVVVMCADTKILDADCQKSALNILINMVCTYSSKACPNIPNIVDCSNSLDVKDGTPVSIRKRGFNRHLADLSSSLRKATWANNGTMTLPNLLTITSPLTDADAIRSLACRVLCGLAKEESIKQIMGKLPLFTDGQLQSLMKEPILPEKRIEHADFCKYCKELIELVTGTSVTSDTGIEPSFQEIKRRLIVANTKIDYDRTEAYHLIHNYLNSEGFPEVAAAFHKAANLASKPIKSLGGCSLPKTQVWSPPINGVTTQESLNGAADTPITSQPQQKSVPQSANSPMPTHLKLNVKTPNNPLGTPKTLMLQKSRLQHPNMYRKINEHNPQEATTLDSIFTEYLRYQHGLCKNPVATCPPFELIAPHRCPEPSSRLSAPVNIAARIMKRRAVPPKYGMYGSKYDRQYIYSKFRPVKLVRDTMDTKTINGTCCSFSNEGQYLFVGTQTGLLKVFNIHSGIVETTYDCHQSPLAYIEPSRTDNLIITTTSMAATPQSILWYFTDIFEAKIRFENDSHAEFGKLSCDKIVSTQDLFARLWDVNTGSSIQKFDRHHRYTCNRATFNYDDTLILNDGALYDVRTGGAIHKFGKFNERINGVFHPNGNELICNSQVWDLRNFKLLQTVPAFDQCQLKFNTMGDVIFSTIMDDQVEDTAIVKYEFRTSFRTFDSHDYSTIATIDLKRTISDLAVKRGDEHIALIESCTNYRNLESYTMDANICRLYEIGKPKYEVDTDIGDDEDEEEVDDEDDGDDDEDDDDDDDDDLEEEDLDDEDDLEEEEDFVDLDDDDHFDFDDENDDENDSNSDLSSQSHDEIVPLNWR